MCLLKWLLGCGWGSKSDTREGKDNFLVWMRSLRFSVAVDDVVAVGCEVTIVRLVDFGAMVLELYFSFGDCFVWSWVVSSNWCFLGVAGVGYVSWVKSEMSMSLIFSLVLTSKISLIAFVMVLGS